MKLTFCYIAISGSALITLRGVRLTTSLTSRAECHEIWELKTPGTTWATTGLLGTTLPLVFYFLCWKQRLVEFQLHETVSLI